MCIRLNAKRSNQLFVGIGGREFLIEQVVGSSCDYFRIDEIIDGEPDTGLAFPTFTGALNHLKELEGK